MSDDVKKKKKKKEKLRQVKRGLRRRAKSERKKKDYTSEDASIRSHLYEFLLQAEENSIICSYLAMPDEFPTASLLEDLHNERNDLQFFCPRIESCVRDGAKMHFYALNFEDGRILRSVLEEDSRGILQPSDKEKKLKTKKLADQDVTAYFIMPGLLFDKKGFRIGYGGGYYDRYLTRHPLKRVLIAPCRSEQYSDEELPHSKRDVPIDLLAMPDGIMCVNPKLELPSSQKEWNKKFIDKD